VTGARQILGDCVLAALLLAAPSRAQTPWIEGEAHIAPLAGGRNTLVVDGWAVASCGRVDLAFLVDGRTIVEAMDPGAVLGVVESSAIEPIAREARERLLRVIASLESESK